MSAGCRSALLVGVLALSWSCDRGARTDDSPLVCDPTRAGEIVLGYQALPRPEEIPWEGRLRGNGFEYLFVDGACRYWVLREAALKSGLDDRGGELTSEQLATLNTTVFARSWGGAADESLPEGPPRQLQLFAWRHQEAIHCSSPCAASTCSWRQPICGDDSGSATATLGRALGQLVDELFEAGVETSDAAVRVAVRAYERDPTAPGEPQLEDFPFLEWEGATSLAALSTSDSEIAFGTPRYGGYPLLEGTEARHIREIAALFHPDTGVHRSWFFLPLLDEGLPYQVLVRTALPFENAAGVVRAPEGFEGTWYREEPGLDEE